MSELLTVYIDNVLIIRKEREFHQKHSRIVLDRLQDNQWYVSSGKCQTFSAKKLTIMVLMGKDGINVKQERFDVLQKGPCQNSVTDYQSFSESLDLFLHFVSKVCKDCSLLNEPFRKWLSRS